MKWQPNNGKNLNCAFCKKEFYVPECRVLLAKYCSRECSDLGRRTTPEAKRKRLRAYYLKRKDYINNRQKEWCKKNPEKRKEIQRRWVLKNRDKMRFYSNLRHYREKFALGKVNFEQVKSLYLKFPFCYYCKINKSNSIDHKIPLSKGGTNNIDNLVPACISCNSKKKDKTELDYMAQIKRDFPNVYS